MKRKSSILLSLLLCGAMVLSMCACGASGSDDTTAASSGTTGAAANVDGSSVTNPSDMTKLKLDSAKWNYDSENKVYWQIGVSYCAEPEADAYETMGIYVPGAYMAGTANSDGTYTCTLNNDATVGGYTAATAPIVMPVNTAGYAAQAAPTSYNVSGLTDYLNAGFVYVYAGCRGRNNGTNSDGTAFAGGAPWGVTDLKAAVRCLRYNASVLPGSTDRIFTFGHSGGGAQSSLMGASGDSSLYYKYLESIGAVMKDDSGNYISDAVCGSMCWCPITNLDVADEAYEWMMGQFATTGTRADSTWTSKLSDDMSAAFAKYINALGLKNGSDTLSLSESDSGIYLKGTYYDYILQTINTSLNNFLADTTFPYTPSNTTMGDGGFGGGQSGQSGTRGAGMSGMAGSMPDMGGSMPDMSGSGFSLPSGGMGGSGSTGTSSSSTSTTYQTVEDYIASLNSDTTWVTYDSTTNTAKVSDMGAFVTHCKNASKDVGAFDSLSLSQAENMVFGNNVDDALHFDATMSSLLTANQSSYSAFSDFDSKYVSDYADDMSNTDGLGTATAVRQNMYNPMYFLCGYYDGCGTSTVARYWRINTGIDQGDTALSTEVDLALALKADTAVKSVDFTTVWGLGHTTAERTGTSSANFISWVNSSLA